MQTTETEPETTETPWFLDWKAERAAEAKQRVNALARVRKIVKGDRPDYLWPLLHFTEQGRERAIAVCGWIDGIAEGDIARGTDLAASLDRQFTHLSFKGTRKTVTLSDGKGSAYHSTRCVIGTSYIPRSFGVGWYYELSDGRKWRRECLKHSPEGRWDSAEYDTDHALGVNPDLTVELDGRYAHSQRVHYTCGMTGGLSWSPASNTWERGT